MKYLRDDESDGGEEDDDDEEEESKESKSTAWFYSTLHLKCIYNTITSYNLLHSFKITGVRKMGHKGEGVTVGCKVLPICDAVSATGPNGADSGGEGSSEKEAGRSGERRRALSRMKELIKWAAAAKSHKVGSKAWKVKRLI